MATNLAQGHFAKKQLFSRSALIRWSHRRRFAVALRKSSGFAGLRVLDLGCGDGTYLAMLMESEFRPKEAMGAELEPRVVEQNRTRFSDIPSLSFVLQSDLDQAGHRESYDAIVCMEVFEHLTNPDDYLDLLYGLLRPSGRLLVSVPVETGLPVVLKQAVRRVAGWRKIGDYASTLPYTWPELARSVFAGSEQHIPRVTHRFGEGLSSHCHKGFNWKNLRDRIAKRFVLDQVSASPVEALPPSLGSQAWFEAHKA